MTELLSKLNSERRSRGIRRVLKAKKISDDISAYRQQVQAIKEDFLVGGLLLPSRFPLTRSQIRTTTTTQLVLSDVQDQVNTRFSALAGAMEASESNITSVIKDNTKEIRTSGVLQSETIEKLQVALRDFQQRGFYKGVVCPFDKLIMFLLLISLPLQVRDLIPGDIYLKAPIFYASGSDEFDDCHAIIDDRPKLVRVFRVQADQKERVMQVCYFPPLFIRILTLPSDFKKK